MQPMPAIHLAEVVGLGDDDVARIAIDEVVDGVPLGQLVGVERLVVQVAANDLARHEAADEAAGVLRRAFAELERAGLGAEECAVVRAVGQSFDDLHQQMRAALGKRIGKHRRPRREIGRAGTQRLQPFRHEQAARAHPCERSHSGSRANRGANRKWTPVFSITQG